MNEFRRCRLGYDANKYRIFGDFSIKFKELVVQRTKMDAEQDEQFLSCMEYMYRTILTNDHNSTEEQVIDKYNQRGLSKKNFDVQNNDFGWAHLPFSTMEDNTVFLPFTAMLKNFYQYLLAKVSEISPCVDMKSRLKRFVFAFIVVPAEWVHVARQWTLNIYTKDRWLHHRTILKASYG